MATGRTWSALATLALGGCICTGEPISDSAYASMASFAPHISACLHGESCNLLCIAVFAFDETVTLDRCDITSIDRVAPPPGSTASPEDPQFILGVQVFTVYRDQVACPELSFDGWSDDSSDDWDDDSSDDGSTDDSCNDSSCDDGSDDTGDDDSDDDPDDDPGDDDTGDYRVPGDDRAPGDYRIPGTSRVHASQTRLTTSAR